MGDEIHRPLLVRHDRDLPLKTSCRGDVPSFAAQHQTFKTVQPGDALLNRYGVCRRPQSLKGCGHGEEGDQPIFA
jgi:hypothetical protein